MINIKTIEVAGFAPALKALHLPFKGDEKSSMRIGNQYIGNYHYGEELVTVCDDDMRLLQTLVKRGDEHAKVLRGVMVWAEITAPVYWWCEAETYRIGHERLSSESTMHTDCKGLNGDELVKAKSEIPMGKELKKIDMFSYQCLRNIYRQRHDHRLPEWRQFCEWVNTLPFASELITIGLED